MIPAFTTPVLPWSDNWKVVVWTGSFFLVVASYGQWAYESADGVDWTERDMGAEKVLGVLDGAGDGSVVVMVGEELSGASYAQVFNAGVWALNSMPYRAAWTSVCKSLATNRYIAVAQGTGNAAATSDDDGATWTARALSDTVPWVSVIHNSNVAVAVGQQSYSVSSDNGVTWSAPAAFSMPIGYETDSIQNIVVVGSRLVVVFEYCVATSDDDGATWSVVVGPGDGRYRYGVTNPWGVLMPSEFYGVCHFSEDGLTWDSAPYAFPSTYDGAGAMAGGESTFVLIRQFSASYVLAKGFVQQDQTAFFLFIF